MALKRLPQEMNESYETVKLYKQDIKELFALVKTHDFTFSIGPYKIASIEDIEELQDKQREPFDSLSLSCSAKPSENIFSISISRKLARITYWTLEDNASTGIISKARDLLKSWRKPYHWLWIMLPVLLAIGIIVGAIILVPAYVPYSPLHGFIDFSLMFVLVIAVLFTWEYLYPLTCTISPLDKSQLPNFWTRNKERIALIVIGAIIGWLVNYLGGLLSDGRTPRIFRNDPAKQAPAATAPASSPTTGEAK